MSSNISLFSGTWPALITPTNLEGGVNRDSLRQLVVYLMGKGVDGLYVCGTTGEGLWMTEQERRQTLEDVLVEAGGKIPIIVHVGSAATRESAGLARHAADCGAAGVSSILPPLLGGIPNILLHYETIASAAPGLPFFPYLFGGQVDAIQLMTELASRIPNLGGTKYTGANLFELSQLVETGQGKWTIFSGYDEQCLFAALVGARGHIGSTLNLMPGTYREIRQLFEAGEVLPARDLQLRVNRVTKVLIDFGFLGALREAMRAIGLECGEVRLPHSPVPLPKRPMLREALEQAGLPELAAM